MDAEACLLTGHGLEGAKGKSVLALLRPTEYMLPHGATGHDLLGACAGPWAPAPPRAPTALPCPVFSPCVCFVSSLIALPRPPLCLVHRPASPVTSPSAATAPPTPLANAQP